MMVINKMKIRKLLLTILIAIFSSVAFAAEDSALMLKLVRQEIDNAFSIRSIEVFDEILRQNLGDKNYPTIENYAVKKIRQLILTNDYDFAKEATLVIIDNNLDNEYAVEMYSLIIESYEIQKEADRKRELELQQERERIEKEKEKARITTEKTYVPTETADGKSVYVSAEKGMNFTRYEWKAQIGLVNFGILSNSLYNAASYGISLNASYEYSFLNFILGGSLFAGLNFANFAADSPVTLMIPLEIAPRIAVTAISRQLFFRVGFLEYIESFDQWSDYVKNLGNPSTQFFTTPLIGLEMDKIHLGPTLLSVGFDWYPAHLFMSNALFAGGVNASLEVQFKELEKTILYFTAGLKDKFIIGNDFDNRLHFVIAVGGKNVIR